MNKTEKTPTNADKAALIIFSPEIFDDNVTPESLLWKLRFIKNHLTIEKYLEIRNFANLWCDVFDDKSILLKATISKDYSAFLCFVQSLIMQEIDALIPLEACQTEMQWFIAVDA